MVVFPEPLIPTAATIRTVFSPSRNDSALKFLINYAYPPCFLWIELNLFMKMGLIRTLGWFIWAVISCQGRLSYNFMLFSEYVNICIFITKLIITLITML